MTRASSARPRRRAGSRSGTRPPPVLRALGTNLVMSDAHVLASSLLPTVTDNGPRQVRGAFFGALWGGGVGIFLNAVMGSQFGTCGGEAPCGLGGLGGALVGGMAGALLGAVLGYHLTDDAPKSATPAPASQRLS